MLNYHEASMLNNLITKNVLALFYICFYVFFVQLYTEQGHRLVSLLQELNGYPPIADSSSDSPGTVSHNVQYYNNLPFAVDGCVTETEEEVFTEGEVDNPDQQQQIIQLASL